MKSLLLLPAFIFVSLALHSVAEQPNIVWIFAEDISTELACYGHPAVKTPVLDQMARDGQLFKRAFGSNPSCSPNRSAMLLGAYQTRTDAQDHRRRTSRPLPPGMKPFPILLNENGYYCAKTCGYYDKVDLNVNVPSGEIWDGNDWKHRDANQPFYAQITLYASHRNPAKGWNPIRKASPNPVNTAEVELPPFFPDTPECRLDWAMYLDSIEKVDRQVGEILERLKKEGIADNTVVIFSGDNGRCHLRGKNWLYDGGLHVPLIMKGPGCGAPGSVQDGMVAMVDITASILHLAGVAIPDWMDGQTLLGEQAKTRNHIFAARDQMGDVMDLCRAVRTERYKYIRNYMPEVGYAESKYTRQNRPMLPVINKLHKEGKLNEAQQLLVANVKPKEELYDVLNDPHEINNLAAATEYQAVLERLRPLLDAWLVETKDTGLERFNNPAQAITGNTPVNASQKAPKNANTVAVAAASASDALKNYQAKKAVDGTISAPSRWIGKIDQSGSARLDLKLAKKQELSGVHVYSGFGNKDPIQDFHFEFKDTEGEWQRIPDSITKANPHTALDIPFDTIEVDTDELRLVVTKSKGDTARVLEIVVWKGEVPKLVKEASSGEVVDRSVHQIAVNQVGYVNSWPKRFTAPLTADGTAFTIQSTDGGPALHQGVINGGLGEFSAFRPSDGATHYVVKIDGGELKANTSDPFLVSETLYDEQFWQPAVDFLIDVRAAIGTHNSAFGGCPWRDGTYYDTVLPSLVLFYLADPERVESMPRQMDWAADKAKIMDPEFKLAKAPNSGGVIEATRNYFKLEPPAPDTPDVIRLIHWGTGYYLVNPETCDPSGDPEKWKIHSQTVEQVAYVVWAWPVLKKWLPQSFYDQCLKFCQNNWAPSLGISKWWHPDSYTDIYADSDKNPWAGKLHPYKGRHAPGHSIVPNLLMYEVAKRDGLANPDTYLNAAVKQAKWIVDTLDWNEPRTTKGHRVSEHRTIPNLVWLQQHYPEHAPPGLKQKITDWSKVAVSRSDNMWDFRRFDLDKEWTIPKLNDVGNSLGLPAIATAASWVVDDPALKQRLRELASSSVDHIFGRNPRLAAAPDLEEKGFPEVERGWPVSHKLDTCARLELCRGSISSLPGTEMFPFQPEAPYRHREGWVNYGANWCISLSYFKFDKNGATTPARVTAP